MSILIGLGLLEGAKQIYQNLFRRCPWDCFRVIYVIPFDPYTVSFNMYQVEGVT
jgi:hypothetical protein